MNAYIWILRYVVDWIIRVQPYPFPSAGIWFVQTKQTRMAVAEVVALQEKNTLSEPGIG